MAGLPPHRGNGGKTEKDKPRSHRPVSEKNREALKLKGKSLAKPLLSLKTVSPHAFYSEE
jgi:hypothetical protein